MIARRFPPHNKPHFKEYIEQPGDKGGTQGIEAKMPSHMEERVLQLPVVHLQPLEPDEFAEPLHRKDAEVKQMARKDF